MQLDAFGLLQLRVADRTVDELGVVEDTGQRIVELVGHGRGKLAQRGHLFHVDDLALRAVELGRLLHQARFEPVGPAGQLLASLA